MGRWLLYRLKSSAISVVVVAVWSVLFMGPGRASNETPANVVVQKDVTYAKADGELLRMDIIRPKTLPATASVPLVICIHGGGWSGGAKRDMMDLAYGCANLGFEAFTIQYRLAPAHTYPSQIDDVMSAIRYAREHAHELGIDPNRIAAIGRSAGGHLALLAAERSADDTPASRERKSALRAAVSISGPTDLTCDLSPIAQNIVRSFMGVALTQSVAAYRQASPIHNLTPYCAPLFLIHGDKDESVPYAQATRMLVACKKLGVPAELYTLHGAGHGGGGDPKESAEVLRKLSDFLQEHLRN